MIYPEGTIETNLISNENGICIFKATVTSGEKILATGTAYEKENSTFINKTSYIENCETSAVGRALGMVGFGIDTSVASFEEVANAMQQQESDKNISKTMEEALRDYIKNKNISTEKVLEVLKKYGYEKLSDIKIKYYKEIQESL